MTTGSVNENPVYAVADLDGCGTIRCSMNPAFSISLSDAPADHPFFDSAVYAGTFNGTADSLNNWTALYAAGFLDGGSVPELLCDDAVCSGAYSFGDAVYMINYIFGGDPAPKCSCR